MKHILYRIGTTFVWNKAMTRILNSFRNFDYTYSIWKKIPQATKTLRRKRYSVSSVVYTSPTDAHLQIWIPLNSPKSRMRYEIEII